MRRRTDHPRKRFARRRAALVGVLLAAVAAGVVVGSGGSGLAAGGGTGGAVLPSLGAADRQAAVFGAVTRGAGAGETWALRRLPADAPEPVVDGGTVEFGATDEQRPAGQLAFLRHRPGGEWQIAAVPQAPGGGALRGPQPNLRSARMSAGGGAVLLGRDSARPSGEQDVAIVREPGGAFVQLARPGGGLLLPEGAPASGDADETPDAASPTSPDATPTSPDAAATTPDAAATTPDAAATTPDAAATTPDPAPATTPDPTAPTTPGAPAELDPLPAEALAGDGGSGRANTAVTDDGSRTTVFIAPVGRDVESAVLVYRDGDWRREPIALPDAPQRFTIAAIAADDAGAWLVADSPGRPLRVFRRDVPAAGDPRWTELELPAGPWTDPARAAEAGLTTPAPLGGQAQVLTTAGRRIWVDLAAQRLDDQATRHATLLVDPSEPVARVTSWCDVEDACDHPLGGAFSVADGYRSFAWDGAGAGARVVSNPLRAPGADDTNAGSWLSLSGTRFERRPGGGGNYRGGAAFHTPDAGWLSGPVEIGAQPAAERTAAWPTGLRAPLAAVVPAPGGSPGDLAAQALAVGSDGGVVRYTPDQGWTREFLLSSSGTVVRAALRGVAWPEPARAHAVGDLGAIWQWRSDTGLWERDPATPVGFEANLTAVAFDPADPQRGYAVGREGALLAYDKTWQQQPLPAGFEEAHFTAISFSGRQAYAVSDAGVLVSDGGPWRVADDVMGLLSRLPGPPPRMVAAAGLPDGGGVLAGRNVVLVRDGAGAAWRTTAQPVVNLTVIAAAATRDGANVRPVISVVPELVYPALDPVIEVEEGTPPPLLGPYALPGDGYLLRETEAGWHDEQRAAWDGAGEDRPRKTDPVLALALDAGGEGWAVGGWSGTADSAGRGTSGSGSGARTVRSRVQTSGVWRYSAHGTPAAAPVAQAAEIPLAGQVARIAIGGHPACAAACADLAPHGIAPDRMAQRALDVAEQLAARPGGPRAFVSTGGRLPSGPARGDDASEQRRFAQLLAPRPGLPVYNAVSAGDVADGSSAAHTAAFAAASAPQGSSSALGILSGAIPGDAADAAGMARTHYAFDTAGQGGALRVVVIDNSAGSLAASDPHQRPAEPQEPWLVAVLDDARARGIPAIVVGSRDLNPRARPALNVADDGDRIAQLLVDHGASAYFYDRPEENRRSAVPAGAPVTIPAFGTGTLGYRSGIQDAEGLGIADARFGDGGFLLTEVDVAARDAATNRAPVAVRLIPVIESLSLDAIDGTLLRRSRPSLFKGIGRRPIAGDRWGRASGDGIPSPSGADPYTSMPADPCVSAGCSTRIEPEYAFASSAPDVLDMVATDPASANPRKPLLGADDKIVSDARSGLVCPFNAGTATVTLAAGGMAVRAAVTVMTGTVARPCGTRPLDPSRIRTIAPGNAGAVAPPPPASPPPSLVPNLVPPPPPAPDAEPAPRRTPRPAPAPPLFSGFTSAPVRADRIGGVSPPPPTPGFFAQPIPPGGATVRVTEEKREQEVATEQSQAYAAITADDRLPSEPFIAGLALIAALAGTTIRPGRRRRPAYVLLRSPAPPRGIAAPPRHRSSPPPSRRSP